MSQPVPTSNKNFSTQYRMGARPDYSEMTRESYSQKLNRERDLQPYRTVWSSKLNVYDQSRVIAPMNRFGVKFGTYNSPRVQYSPAGFDGVNNTRATGESFTKPFVKRYNVI